MKKIDRPDQVPPSQVRSSRVHGTPSSPHEQPRRSRWRVVIAAATALSLALLVGPRDEAAIGEDPLVAIGKLADIDGLLEGIHAGLPGSKEQALARMTALRDLGETLAAHAAKEQGHDQDLLDHSQKAWNALNALSEALGGDMPGARADSRSQRTGLLARSGRWQFVGGHPIVGDGGRSVGSQIFVSGTDSEVRDLDVITSLSRLPEGSVITLTSPQGTTVELNGAALAADGAILWDDDADSRAGTVSALEGLLLDEDDPASDLAAWRAPSGSLGAFVGENPNGAWTLSAQSPDGGALELGSSGALDSGMAFALSLETVPGLPDVPPMTMAACVPTPSGPFASTGSVAIPDSGSASNNCASSSIVVASVGAYLTDVNVQTFITHTFAGDLDFTVTSPSGTVVTLSTDNGGGSDNVFNGTIWDDQANPAGQVPYTANLGLTTDHTYVNNVVATPLAPEEGLSAFVGEDPNGTWTLRVCDDAGGDIGTINSWNLDFLTLPSAPSLTVSNFTNTTAVDVPTGPAVVSSSIAVAAIGTQVAKVRVQTFLTHTNCADIDMTLLSPSGKVVTLTTDNGGTSDNLFNGTMWDTDANPGGNVAYTSNVPAPGHGGLVTDSLYTNLVPVTTLSPEESLGLFAGDDPNGTWTLTISDDASSNGGTLSSWTLEITTSDCTSCSSDADCDDSLNCTIDACDLGTSSCTFTPVTCDDGNPCTIDTCDPATGACIFTNRADGSDCSDGLACNGAETCVAGTCTPGTPIACDDGNPCTLDACTEPAGTCAFTPTSNPCDDGNSCTINDTCEPSTFAEDFDGVTAPALPAGWTTSAVGAGALWATLTTSNDTPPNAAFTNNPPTASQQSLVAPSLFVASMPAQLTFRNRYATENAWDGGVLEIAIGAGAFQDILAAGGSFASGGYNGTLNAGSANPLAGRQAWTGTSAGFVLTTVNLPPASAGEDIVLRWRMGSDGSVGATGWWIDTISASLGSACVGEPIVCDDGDPCTTDTCEDGIGCVSTPTVCDDLDACTADTCVPGIGCQFTPAVDCDDGDDCTLDSCDPATGTCVYSPNPACLGGCCLPDGCDLQLESACAALGGVFLGEGTPCPGPVTYSIPAGVAIIDVGTISHSFVVPDSSIMTDVDVGLDITHTFIGDLEIRLTHEPSGTVVLLADNRCGGTDNYPNILLDDEASATIASNCATLANSVRLPDNPLSAFDGFDSAGTWTLTITDTAGGDVGTLNSWSLHISGTGGASSCPSFGACCLDDEECEIKTEDSCNALGGAWQGPDTSCFVAHVGPGGGGGPSYVVNPGLAIPDSPSPGITSTISVSDDFVPTDVIVDLHITHTWFSDIFVSLTHGSTTVVLVDNRGGSSDSVDILLDDDGAPFPATWPGTLTGSYQPNAPLSAFDGVDPTGDWTLLVRDEAGGDTGTLVRWSLHFTAAVSICNEVASCDAGGPYTSDCREAVIDGATVTDPEDDAITFYWSSSNPNVSVSPATGVVPAGPGARPIPPVTATLSPFVNPTGVVSTLTLTVEDVRGISTCTTEVTFHDLTPPVLTCPPDVAFDCGSTLETDPDVTGWATAEDDCPAATVTFVPVQLTPFIGLTADVVLNDGAGPMDVVQVTIDQATATPFAGFVFATQTGATSLCGATGTGLPDDGFFPANAFHPDVQLAIDNEDDGPNARQLLSINTQFSFAIPPANYTELHVYATAGQNPNTMRVSVAYDDATVQVFPDRVVDDWFTDFVETPDRYYLIDGMDRVRPNGAAGLAPICQDSNDPAIFGYRFLTDPTRQAVSVTILRTTAGDADSRLNFFGAVAIEQQLEPPSEVVVTFTDEVVTGGCPAAGSVLRTWFATDAFGNTASCTQSIAVVDNVPPVFTEEPMLGGSGCTYLWPPMHGYVDFSIDEVTGSATDACSPGVTLAFGACESSQAEDSTGDGSSMRDCVISPDGSIISLRAERSGGCDAGRSYSIRLSATDDCGNVALSAPMSVCVWHDRSQEPPGPYRSANPGSNQNDSRPGTNGTYGADGCGTGCGCAP